MVLSASGLGLLLAAGPRFGLLLGLGGLVLAVGLGRGDGAGSRAVLGEPFLLDPGVGLGHAVAQPGVGLPAEDLLDEGVVGVAPAHALGGVELVGAVQGDAGDVLGDGDELV